MANAVDILGFGSVAIDDLIYVDGPFTAGKGRVTKRLTDHGGNVATGLIAAQRLGARTGFIGWLPKEGADDTSLRDMQSHNVDVSQAPRHENASTIHSTIIVDTDGNRFIAYDDTVQHGTSSELPDAVLGTARLLMIDAYATHSLDVVARARALGLDVVADIEWSAGSETTQLLALCNHLVVPMSFACAQTGLKNPVAVLNALWSDTRSAVVLTDGENGLYLRQANDRNLWHVGAHDIEVVDTTGAGDCFHGAYAAALIRDLSPLSCAEYANAAAAISVSGRGGRLALPDHTACVDLLNSQSFSGDVIGVGK